MKIFLIGDAARQADLLSSFLPRVELVALPREAGHLSTFDDRIGPDDVVVSLRFKRTATAPAFAILHVPGAGLDGIEFSALQPDCRVCNVFEHEGPISEYVLHRILDWELRPSDMRFEAIGWGDAHRNRRPHGEIAGKTIGIVGFGRIGRAIAERARAFGMRIATLDRSIGGAEHLVDVAFPPARLNELLTASDYVVLACPLTEKTHGMIGAAELAAMRRTAVLINVSRAEIVEEDALFDALAANRIGGAVLDVWYRYPVDATDNPAPSARPFLDLPNVVATAHSSAWTTALPERRYRFIADNIQRLARGEPLVNQVWPRAGKQDIAS